MENKRTVVTTSWDDGDRADLKLADLLHSRGIPATLYVPIEPYLQRPALRLAELRMLVEAGFEVGDEVIAIKGHKIREYALWQLQDLFKEAGKDMEVKLRRGEKPLELKLRLRSLL